MLEGTFNFCEGGNLTPLNFHDELSHLSSRDREFSVEAMHQCPEDKIPKKILYFIKKTRVISRKKKYSLGQPSCVMCMCCRHDTSTKK